MIDTWKENESSSTGHRGAHQLRHPASALLERSEERPKSQDSQEHLLSANCLRPTPNAVPDVMEAFRCQEAGEHTSWETEK